jgi:hypothetical protein
MDQIPAVQQEVAGLLDSSLGTSAQAPEATPEPAPATVPEP